MLCNGFVFLVRGFGCVQNQVLSTYCKSARSSQKVDHSEWDGQNKRNKPGTAQVGAISKGQQQQKDFKVSKYSFLLQKNWRRGTFGEKKIFEKKSHNAEKTGRGTLWDFSTSVLSGNSKKLKGDPLGKTFFSQKKVSQSRKVFKGSTLRYRGVFQMMWKDVANFCAIIKRFSKVYENCKKSGPLRVRLSTEKNNKQDGKVPSRRHI